jgi:hypothetical protein
MIPIFIRGVLQSQRIEMQHRVICFASNRAAHETLKRPQSDWEFHIRPLVNVGCANPHTRWAPPFPEKICSPAALISISAVGSCSTFKSAPTFMGEMRSPDGEQDGRKITEIDWNAVQDTQPHGLLRAIFDIIQPALYGMPS